MSRRRALGRLAAVLGAVKGLQLAIDARPLMFWGDSWVYVASALGHFVPEDRSWTYGLLLRLVAVAPHRAGGAVLAQALAGAASCWVLAHLLQRRLAVRAWIAAAAALALAWEPLHVLQERLLLTESFAGLAFLLFLAVGAAYLARPALPALAGVCCAGVLLLSLRTVYVPVTWAAAVALPLLAVPWNRRRAARHLALALLATALLHQGYRQATGGLIGRAPAYVHAGGLFAAAALWPLVEPGDAPDPGTAALIARLRQRPPQLPAFAVEKEFHRWQPGGLASELIRLHGASDRADAVAAKVGRAVLRRDPLGVVREGLRSFAAVWTVAYPGERAAAESGGRNPAGGPMAAVSLDAFGSDFSQAPATPSIRWHAASTATYPWYSLAPFAWLLVAARERSRRRAVALFVALATGLLLAATCTLSLVPSYRFLHPFVPALLGALGLLADRTLREAGSRQRRARPLSLVVALVWLGIVAAGFVATAGALVEASWLAICLFLAYLGVWSTTVPFVASLLAARSAGPLPGSAPSGLAVDVLIPTLDEEPAFLRRTVRRALALRYPHTTWLLDDGDRPEVKRLAAELGCSYLARRERAGAKAGNLNAGLSATSGDFVLVLDADALAHPDTLDRLLGHFHDPAVALVQAPQVFYNVDALDADFDPLARTLWSNGELFQVLVQRGHAAHGAALCVGSGFVFRRSAVAGVGGIPTDSVSEDVPLSFELHRAGWQTRFHEEALVYHLAPDGLAEFWSQHRRWARGALGIARRLPKARGLRPLQFAVYAKFLVGHASDLLWYPIRLVPALAALGLVPLDLPDLAGQPTVVVLGGLACVLSYAVPPLLSGLLFRPLLARAFSLLRAGPVAAALWPTRVGLQFGATPKGTGSRAPLAAYLLPGLAGVLGAAGVIATVLVGARGPVSAGGVLLGAFCLELLVTGALALWLCRGRHVTAAVETLPVRLAATLDGRERLEVVRLGREHAFALGRRGIPGGRGRLRLELPDGALDVEARIEPAADLVEPSSDSGCYRLVLFPGAPEGDRITDAVDAVEIPRLFASLRRSPCPAPPGATGVAGPIPFYRVRPAFPRVRF